jgi:hypothetical protein
MIIFFIVNSLVYLCGDTLVFVKNDSIIDKWVVKEETCKADSVVKLRIKRTKVSPGNRAFLIYEEQLGDNYELIKTEVVFYNADQDEIWRESHDFKGKIWCGLTNVYDSLFITTVTDVSGKYPRLSVIKDSVKTTVIKKDDWIKIAKYKLSPNCRYLVLHTRKSYLRKIWDYIYFIDLKTNKRWEYLFPTCLTCKRGTFTLGVDDNGQAEVVYKSEHRIFSKEGKLIDVFIKVE